MGLPHKQSEAQLAFHRSRLRRPKLEQVQALPKGFALKIRPSQAGRRLDSVRSGRYLCHKLALLESELFVVESPACLKIGAEFGAAKVCSQDFDWHFVFQEEPVVEFLFSHLASLNKFLSEGSNLEGA
jgi:hypothetical protein